MSEAAELPLGRGRQELRAAEALLEAGFPAQAVGRAYLAGLHAASAALTVLGERPATSVGVISAFGRHVVGDDGVDHETGRILRRLYEDRNEVDYGLVEAPAGEARNAIEDAGRLVEAAASWIGRRSAAS
ncbi:MAG: HEPN domain-containing protein [Thermoleophilaceae bacterium]